MSLPVKIFQCGKCEQTIEVPQGAPKSPSPRCSAPARVIHRINKGSPGGRRGGGPPWQRSPP